MDPRLLVAIVLIVAELVLVTAVALFFSTFSSPLLAALLTLGPVGGRPLQQRPAAVRERRGSRGRRLDRARLYYVLPNLAPFDVKAEVVLRRARRARRTSLYTLAYAVVYIGVLLTAAMAIFRRRDFK